MHGARLYANPSVAGSVHACAGTGVPPDMSADNGFNVSFRSCQHA